MGIGSCEFKKKVGTWFLVFLNLTCWVYKKCGNRGPVSLKHGNNTKCGRLWNIQMSKQMDSTLSEIDWISAKPFISCAMCLPNLSRMLTHSGTALVSHLFFLQFTLLTRTRIVKLPGFEIHLLHIYVKCADRIENYTGITVSNLGPSTIAEQIFSELFSYNRNDTTEW